jgi:hypothetical protein
VAQKIATPSSTKIHITGSLPCGGCCGDENGVNCGLAPGGCWGTDFLAGEPGMSGDPQHSGAIPPPDADDGDVTWATWCNDEVGGQGLRGAD